MKVKIAYQVDETEEAEAVAADLQKRLVGVKRKESDAHPPFKHIYLTTKRPLTKAKRRGTV